MSKKVIIVLVLGFVLVICAVIFCCVGIGALGLDFFNDQVKEVEEEAIQPLCEIETLTDAKYSKYFDVNEMTSYQAQDALSEAFPAGTDCDDFASKGFYDLFASNKNFDIKSDTDEKFVEYGFTNVDDEKVTLYLHEISGDWKVYDIEVN